MEETRVVRTWASSHFFSIACHPLPLARCSFATLTSSRKSIGCKGHRSVSQVSQSSGSRPVRSEDPPRTGGL